LFQGRRIAAFTLGAVAFAVGSLVVAQQTTDGPYVLHEFVSEQVLSGAASAPRPFGSGESRDGADGASSDQTTPSSPATRTPGQPPPLTTEATDDEPVYDSDGPVAKDDIEAPHGPLNPFGEPNVLDDRTDRVNSLTYFATFDPSVIPLKRVVSQNEVVRVEGGEYAVKVGAHPRTELYAGGRAAAGDETFWGSFLLRTKPDEYHPIASVSPEQRILEVQSEPDVPVRLFKDRAGNFMIRTEHEGLLRLNMRVAVDPFYFSGEFDENVQWDDFGAFEDSPLLDRQIRQRARRVLRDMGVTRSMTPANAVRKLVAHYRDFEARPLPDELKTGDLFEAITTSKIGVCRHRSLSFVVAAQALGIPAHYVNNEAHAFVEIGWPGRGWRRIDLGGAADELNAAADGGRSLHQPASDSLPRPDRYLEEQRLMAQNGLGGDTGADGAADSDGAGDSNAEGSVGEAAGESAGAQDPRDSSEAAESDDGTIADGVDGAAASDGADVREREFLAQMMAGESDDAELAPAEAMTREMQRELARELAQNPEQSGGGPAQTLKGTRLELSEAATTVRRGGTLQVVGILRTANGLPIADARVRAYLGPPGTRSVFGAIPVGEARTDQRGRVVIRGEIPKEQSTGRWSLFLAFPGDKRYAPSVAE
jgi:hypothetical protein